MKIKILFSTLLILGSLNLNSQEYDMQCDCPHTDQSYQENVHLNYVEFHQHLPMVNDDGSDITKPHFMDRFTRFPVAYVSGDRAEVSAFFTSSCSHPLWIKGETKHYGGQDNFSFPEIYVEPNSEGDYFYPISEALSEFEDNKVNAFVSFRIEWYVVSGSKPVLPGSGKRDWEKVGESINALFVTHHNPITHIEAHEIHQENATELFLSTIGNSCKAAAGQSEHDDIVEGIHDLFESHWVPLVANSGGDASFGLGYWTGPGAETCSSTSELYSTEVGRSFNFAELMTDMIRVQGLHDSVIKRVTYKNGAARAEMLPHLSWDIMRDMFNVDDLTDIDETSTQTETATTLARVTELSSSLQLGYILADVPSNPLELGPFLLDIADDLETNRDPAVALDDGGFLEEIPFMYVRNYGNMSRRAFHLDNDSGLTEFTFPRTDAPTILKLVDENGIPGQGTFSGTWGNTDPPSVFTELYIVEFEGRYYDPSYGTPSTSSIKQWEKNTFQGYGLGIIDLPLTVSTVPHVKTDQYIHWIDSIENNDDQDVTIE